MSQEEQDAVALWLGCLNRIIACAEAIAQTARIRGDDTTLLAGCLFARSISTARAVVHLIGLGHVVEARVLTRSMFENAFYLLRLAQDDGGAFACEMKADEAFYHHALGQTMLKEEHARAAMGGEVQSRIQAIVKQSRQENPNAAPLKPQKVIAGTEISSASVIYQKLSSDAAHPSVTALKRHFVEGAGKDGLLLKPRAWDGEATDTASLASMALRIVCIAANDAFGSTAEAERRLEGLVAEYDDTVARTLPA